MGTLTGMMPSERRPTRIEERDAVYQGVAEQREMNGVCESWSPFSESQLFRLLV